MSVQKTKDLINSHRWRVFQYMNRIAQEVMRRGNEHDQSKLESPELEIYAHNVDEFEKYPFGSEGYNKAKAALKEATDHHFKHNRHHPEHFEDGIEGMNLVDLLEVVCDWKSATLNHPEQPGDMQKSLQVAVERYKISPQLAKILYNTMRDYGLT